LRLLPADEIDSLRRYTVVGEKGDRPGAPNARGVVRVEPLIREAGPADLTLWEPHYGRLAEAQRRWEAAHGRALPRG
jgi:hypothetical protein